MAMVEADSLAALQGLHQDLLALCDNRLRNLERLVHELRNRIGEFQQLLEHKPKNDQSRRQLSQDTDALEIDGTSYTINNEFKEEVIQIADELELDELEAAALYLHALEWDAPVLDRSPIVSAIIRFHKKRQYLLECLRLLFSLTVADLENAELANHLTFVKNKVLGFSNGQIDTGSKYWLKCVATMAGIEAWLHRLSDLSQRVSILGGSSPDAIQIMDFENVTLLTQHETLASLTTQLTKDGYIDQEDFRHLLAKVQTLDRHDLILVHYLPVLLSCIAKFGPSDCTPEQAKRLNDLIVPNKDSETWALRNFHAATYIWWSAEYFSRISTEEGEKNELDELPRFEKALQDGAFHFMLSIAQDIKRSDWYDPAKTGLVSFLLQETSTLQPETPRPAAFFQSLLMEQYQSFVDAFITNMPNVLRNLKVEEDNQRRDLLSRFNRSTTEYQYHLERFLVILAYAFEDNPEAAGAFWDDAEGNLYGFLQWAAKRQTTPRVAAFCEMLRSICENQQSANAAHQFLLEEGAPVAGKLRRTGSLSWAQIFAELEIYASSIQNRPAPVYASSFGLGQSIPDQMVEPESSMMLECYLRLVSHLCRQSTVAREWVLSRDSTVLSFPNILFALCASNIEGRLRACAWTTLAALLTDKDHHIGNNLWVSLDAWISGGASPGSAARPSLQGSSVWSEHQIFEKIASGFEESNAFLGFLNALVAPDITETGLNDSLPFPENLGAAYRMPGIDSFVDFAVGKVFGEKASEIPDVIQLRILRLNCLDFIATCLSTFNEDLVVVSNRASFPVESAMRSSSLEVYVTLHPFARVMEWVFNRDVLKALFESAYQDVDEVNMAASDSPFILSLVRSVEIMNMIMKLQATYLAIIRPFVKKQSTTRKPPIPHSTIATFEDALLNNMNIIPNIGLYCGTGHQDLTVACLSLLEKLSSAKKLIVSPSAGFGKSSEGSKLIGIFEMNNEVERISRSLMADLQLDDRELEAQQIASGYVIKTSVISFLHNCLLALPDRPTIAHLLLGFFCRANELEIHPEGLFANDSSLFHAVLRLALDYPEGAPVPSTLQTHGEDTKEQEESPNVGRWSYYAWAGNIKVASIEILSKLWKSPLSSALVMTELRFKEYIFAQALRQAIVNTTTLWDGRTIAEPEFLIEDSAIALRNFLRQRAAFFDYFARELRVSVKEQMNGLLTRLKSTLLGQTTLPGEESRANPTLFDLFDFMELELGGDIVPPTLTYLGEMDFRFCRWDPDDPSSPYSLARAQGLIQLHKNEVCAAGELIEGGPNELIFEEETRYVLISLQRSNNQQEIFLAHAETLQRWAQLVVIAVESCDFDEPSRTSFVLQIFQLVLPKLERAFSDDEVTVLVLLALIQPLMKYVESAASSSETKSIDFGNDTVFHVFRICVNGVFSLVTTAETRELCYQTCYYFLRSSLKVSKKGAARARLTLRSIKLAGDRFMDVLCDDAYSGQGSCRVSALLFLDALVQLANQEGSKHMMETFDRVNFVGILVDSIKQMPVDLGDASSGEIPSILAFYNASLALLLRISQTRLGATHVINAGLFQSVRESNIFSADPDIGLGKSFPIISLSLLLTGAEMENPEALKKFFDLMLAVLRILNAVLLSRGHKNDQTVKLARDFLEENRNSIVSVFKRHASVGGLKIESRDLAIDLGELVDCYTLLIAATEFLEYEVTASSQRTPLSAFS